MTVNHDVVGSSPTGGVSKRSKERFFIYLSEVILILFLFSSLLIFNIFYKFVIFDSFILSNFVVYLIDFTLI